MLILENETSAFKFMAMQKKNKTEPDSIRVLTTMGTKKCPWGCIYCFVDNENYPGLDSIDVPDAEEIYQLTNKKVDIIQPAADVEISLVPGYIDLLDKLADLGKNISFSTKAKLTKANIEALKRINEKLMSKGVILQVAVSILKIRNWNEIEKHTPSPFERIETLKSLYEAGIPTSVAFRPLLPFIEEDEIKEIVDLTHQYTHAYLTGPVYLTPALKKYMNEKGYKYELDTKNVSWLPGSPLMEVVHSSRLELKLIEYSQDYLVPVFKSNIDLVRGLAKKFC